MLAKRIIPCLDIKDGRVVKGVNFVNLRDAGDPVEQARLYDEQGADELVFLDISATHEGRKTTLELVSRVAETVFMPLTVGGGIREVDDMRNLLLAGADKVSVNSAAVKRLNYCRKARRVLARSVLCWRLMRAEWAPVGKSMSTADVCQRELMQLNGQCAAWNWARAKSCSPAWMRMARSLAMTLN